MPQGKDVPAWIRQRVALAYQEDPNRTAPQIRGAVADEIRQRGGALPSVDWIRKFLAPMKDEDPRDLPWVPGMPLERQPESGTFRGLLDAWKERVAVGLGHAFTVREANWFCRMWPLVNGPKQEESAWDESVEKYQSVARVASVMASRERTFEAGLKSSRGETVRRLLSGDWFADLAAFLAFQPYESPKHMWAYRTAVNSDFVRSLQTAGAGMLPEELKPVWRGRDLPEEADRVLTQLGPVGRPVLLALRSRFLATDHAKSLSLLKRVELEERLARDVMKHARELEKKEHITEEVKRMCDWCPDWLEAIFRHEAELKAL